MTERASIRSGSLWLILDLPDQGMPRIVAYADDHDGKDIEGLGLRGARVNGMDIDVPSAVLLPTGGLGYFGWPAIAGHRDGRAFTLSPSAWTGASNGNCLRLTGSDPVARVDVQIDIAAGDDSLFEMSARLTNRGADTYTLDRMMAGSLLIPAGEAELTNFTGSWGREFQTRTKPLAHGLHLQESRRGRTSHDRTPTLFIQTGAMVHAVHLGWSGNHVMAIDQLDDGRRMVHAGELFEPGEMRLAPGEHYQTPTVTHVITHNDLESAAYILRRHAWSHVVDRANGAPRLHQKSPRPVTLNTWEGTYFNHKTEQLTAQADVAAKLGIERFVLDDGWFGRRDDDTSSLGDWQIDRRKYPDGLKPLVNHVTGLGMQFGLWVEPEMVNPNSDLMRAHPDWALQIPGRPLLLSRNQLVLDLTRQEVSDYLFKSLDSVLKAHAITYLKWDMNRDLTQVGDAEGRAATARQTRMVYRLLDRIRNAHPRVEIESCASGGGRADYGVLERTHRLWTSDATDALERLDIQHGASMVFPAGILGAHVSGSPNHQTHRRHTLSFRALVAFAYHFGVELDPLTLSAAEKTELGEWITLHKRLRPILHNPDWQFQLPPLDGRYVWGAESPEKIVVVIAQSGQMRNEQAAPLMIPVRNGKSGRWRVASVHPAAPDTIRPSAAQRDLLAGQSTFSIATLRAAGLLIPMLRPESGMVLELEFIEGLDHG